MPAVGRLRFVEAPAQGRTKGTLVFIHAFPLSARMWEPQLALAADGWRVVAPHLRGMDGGEHDPVTSSIDDFAGDIVDLLDALHIDTAVIGGLSLGGYVAFALFRHAAHYFKGLILADTRPQADSPEGVQGRKRMLATLKNDGVRAVADEMVPKLLGETTRRHAPETVERVRSLILANPDSAIAGAIGAMMSRPDSTPLLSSIRCPTLIVVGEEDTLTAPQASLEMHQAIKTSDFVVIPRAGHLSSLEQPDAFNAAVAGFLRGHF